MVSAQRWPQATTSVRFGAKRPSLRSPGGTFAPQNEPQRKKLSINLFESHKIALSIYLYLT